MNILYGLFYTVFSMAIVSSMAFSTVVVIRFFAMKIPKKYILYLWWLFLIRSICPVSLSSIFSISPLVNRKFHMLLDGMGLSFKSENGILTGWQSVFIQPFTVNMNFRICSFLWFAGVIFIWIYIFVKQAGIRKWLKQAKKLDGKIYQHDKLNIPVMTGIFRLKKYLPGKMNAAEAKYTLRHMEIHEERKDGVLRALVFLALSIQWFNPFMWIAYYFVFRDIETAADEDTVSFFGIENRSQYAQEVINMDKGKRVIKPSLVTFQENYIEDRAAKMLYQESMSKKDKQLAVLIVLLLFIWWFMLRPICIMWDDGSWGRNDIKQAQTEQTDAPLFQNNEQTIVAKTNVKSADGLVKVVKIVMVDGEENESGYVGRFKFILEDDAGNKLDEERLSGLFDGKDDEELYFEKDMIICVSDYNNDNINELAIGQDIEVSKENLKALFGRKPKEKEKKKIKNIQEYYLWNIEADMLQRISEPMYFTGKKGTEANSCEFKTPKDTNGIIKGKAVKKTNYYVWDGSSKMFVRKKLNKKQLKKYKKENADKSESTDKITHSLKDSSDREMIRVTTQKDDTGSEAIESIDISPNGVVKSIKKIKGYYCDLQWVQTTDDDEKRYAVLTYNGTKAQTFVILDTQQKNIYYKQGDGNSVVVSLFNRYNGDSGNISFSKDDIVVYTLQEKDKDILKIGFAANAKNNVTVKGSYKYDIENHNEYDFIYSQSTNMEQ